MMPLATDYDTAAFAGALVVQPLQPQGILHDAPIVLPGGGVSISECAAAIFQRIGPTHTLFQRGGVTVETTEDTGDPLLLRMLDIMAVGNIAKNCFKPAEIDPDTGELIKENGLHYWIASDDRIHGQLSVTETGRPRAWKPNVLNLASYVHEGVARGMAEVLKEEHAKGTLPPQFEVFLDPKKIPSVRSVVDVTDVAPLEGSIGWCIVESDSRFAP